MIIPAVSVSFNYNNRLCISRSRLLSVLIWLCRCFLRLRCRPTWPQVAQLKAAEQACESSLSDDEVLIFLPFTIPVSLGVQAYTTIEALTVLPVFHARIKASHMGICNFAC